MSFPREIRSLFAAAVVVPIRRCRICCLGAIATVHLMVAPGLPAAEKSVATTPASPPRTTVTRKLLHYSPAPADNPLKGFVPFRGDYGEEAFSHSLEWAYFPLSAVMPEDGHFDFDAEFEPALDEIAGRRHQAALRFYLDYPSSPSGVPAFLIDAGLKMHTYTEHGGGLSPDYENEALLVALEQFIAALGERYDGDPRLGYLTLGLLGFWGEWHTFPHDDWFPGREVQERILRAYAKAFSSTPLLMRYPLPKASQWPVGLHDDSFAHSTLGPEDWQFLPRIERSGASDLWKSHPIGGEVRPEVQAVMWHAEPREDKGYQDFDRCVRRSHATWLINQALFQNHAALPDDQRQRAIDAARSLGYELHVTSASFADQVAPGGAHEVDIHIENRGVAPFYQDWPVELAIGDRRTITDWKLSTILPDAEKATRWRIRIVPESPLPSGELLLRMRVRQPLENGLPLRFANAEQQADGWLDLGTVLVR